MVFELVEKNLILLGISRKQSIFAFYAKVFIGNLLLSSSVILHIKFLYRDDVTIEEYTKSLFMTSITSMSFLCYANMIQKKEKFFELIDMFESAILIFGKSESNFNFSFKLEVECVIQVTLSQALLVFKRRCK